jgi:hypothetical protein
MSAYALNKMLRDLNQSSVKRQQYFENAENFAEAYELDARGLTAFLTFDVATLPRPNSSVLAGLFRHPGAPAF